MLTHLINLSMVFSHVPAQWKTAIIYDVAKLETSATPSDYIPLSVTPVLSRLVERELVHRYMYPAFESPSMAQLFADLHAFRPIGSTTTALI